MANKSNGSCLGALIGLVLYTIVGALTFDYSLYTIFGKNAHWVWDIVGGLFVGWVSVPAWIVCLIMRSTGMEAPFVGG